jgi:hypothetical protein
MKKLFTLFSLGLILSWTTQEVTAQNLMLFQDHLANPIANGTEITYTGSQADFELQSDVECALNGSVSKDVNVRRYELNVLDSTLNYFCWGLCYLEQYAGTIPLWVSQDPLFAMTPGAFTTDFHAYFQPNNRVGSMKFRYVWYDLNNAADTSWLDIEFVTDPVGVDELANPVVEFELFPNPVVGNVLNVNVEMATLGESTAIVLHNVLGEEVLRESLNSANSVAALNISGIENGVYFCSIIQGGNLIASERLVVAD